MTDVVIQSPTTIAQYEVRVPNFVAYNDLDQADPMLKYSFVINRIAEPQDVTRVQVGARMPLPSHTLMIGDIINEIYRAGGLEATGLQILALVEAVIDKHKGDGIDSSNINPA